MYERMLNKLNKPTLNEFFDYCGECKELLVDLFNYLSMEIKSDTLLRFPYGNKYGWGIKFSKKSKHICDVFAEKDAFTIMIRLTDEQFEQIYNDVSTYIREYIDNKYPCSEGGWVHIRVLDRNHLDDVKKLMMKKINN